MLGQKLNVERIEPLGFVEIRFAVVPLTSPPRNICKRFRNSAAIREELMCFLKVTHSCVVILKAGIIVKPICKQRLAEFGLKSERGFGCQTCLLAQGHCW